MTLTVDQEEKMQYQLSVVAEHRGSLNDWERNFFDDVTKRFEEWGSKMNFSGKQWSTLNNIYEKCTDAR